VNKLNNVNVNYLKTTKGIGGRTKHPRGPHSGHVFETPEIRWGTLANEVEEFCK